MDKIKTKTQQKFKFKLYSKPYLNVVMLECNFGSLSLPGC